jgi:chemotaxis response regulator CheB
MKLSGHKTESVYRRYAIVSESDMEAAVSKLNLLGRQSQVVAVGASAGGPQPT